MEPRPAVALLNLAFSLLVYPAALTVPLLALMFRKEGKEKKGRWELLRLMGASSLILFSSTLQVLFTHIDVIQDLPGDVRTGLFIFLSQIFWIGLFLFGRFFHSLILSLSSNDRERSALLKILSPLTLGFLSVLLLLFALAAFPALSGMGFVQRGLPPVLILTSAGIAVMMGYSLFTAFRFRRTLAYPSLLWFLLGGDGLFALVFLLQSRFFSWFPVSLFFLFHFTLLFILFDRIRRTEGHREGDNPIKKLTDQGLSPREADVALALGEGLSYQQTADRFFISLSTVQTHVGRIYRKLDIKNKTELARLISRLNSAE